MLFGNIETNMTFSMSFYGNRYKNQFSALISRLLGELQSEGSRLKKGNTKTVFSTVCLYRLVFI